MNRQLDLGITGFLIALALNLFAWKYLGKADAEFFTDGWWSSWFPAFAVWCTFLCIGIGKELKRQAAERS